MARYDGLIIPRSYSEYINKTDAATLSQALQLGGVLDSAPTEDSVKAVKSGGVFDALAGKQSALTFDNVPTENSDNPVKSGGVFDALGTKQDTLTFDDTPTAGSDNPVKSGGIKSYVDNMQTYSTTEVNTGKVWIDGKPIYRKVIDFGALPNTGEKKVAHNISNLGDIIKYDCITTNGTIYRPVIDVGNSLMANNISMAITQTEVGIQTGANKTEFTQTYVILEYTKSTD